MVDALGSSKLLAKLPHMSFEVFIVVHSLLISLVETKLLHADMAFLPFNMFVLVNYMKVMWLTKTTP